MKNRLYWLLIFLFSIGIYGQNNTIIINTATGSLLRDTVEYCPGTTFSLTTYATATATGNYAISKASPTLYPFQAGYDLIQFNSSTVNTNNNKFSKPISLGFTFPFFDKTYKKVVVGINGRLVFTNDAVLDNLWDNTIYKDKTFTGALNSGPLTPLNSTNYNQVYLNNTNEINLAQIFFGFTDLNTNINSSTIRTYKPLTLSDGKKAMLISFQNAVFSDYTGSFNSHVLLVDDGRIIVYVDGKTRTNVNAIIGIQNDTASNTPVLVPVSDSSHNYNNGHWGSTGDAFIFTPNQNLTPIYNWKVDGVSKSTAKDFSYTPSNDQETLSLDVTFSEDSALKKSASVKFKYYAKPTITSKVGTACGQATTLAVNNPISGTTYTWYSDDPAFQQTGTSISAAKSGSYYVVPNGCVSQKSDPVNVVISSQLTPLSFTDGKVLTDCDNLAQASKSYNLSALTGYLPGTDYTIEFTDAAGNIIANAANNYMATVNSGETRSFKIVVTSLRDSTCRITTGNNFSVNYQSFPVDANLVSRKLCLGTTSYSVNDFKTDFPAYSNFDISFSKDGSSFTENMVNPTAYNSVYVKISGIDYSCSTIIKLIFDFYPEIHVNTFTQFPEHCSSTDEYFDLNQTKSELQYDDVTAEFYESYDPTTKTFSNQITNLHYRPSGIRKIYVKLSNSHGCFHLGAPPELNFIIYQKPRLIKNTPETKYSFCGSSLFNLTTNITDYIGNNWPHYSEIRYFDGNNRRLDRSEWENYNLAAGQPKMIFVYNTTNNLQCTDIIGFNLIQRTIPSLINNRIAVCEETSISKEEFVKKTIGSANYYITLADGTPLPENITWTALPHTLQVKLLDASPTGCESGILDVTFYQPAATPVTPIVTPIVECDDKDGVIDGKTQFNLDSYKNSLTNDPNAIIEYFKDPALTQRITSSYTNETAFNQKIYARITSSGFCPSSTEINLKVNVPAEINYTANTSLCYREKLTVTVNNFADFSSVKLIKPDKTEVNFNTETLELPYESLKFEETYKIIAISRNDCVAPEKTFTLSDANQPKILNVSTKNNQIAVNAADAAKYFFAACTNSGNCDNNDYLPTNSEPWQSSNVLLNPTASAYRIWVKSSSDCLGVPITVYFISVNNVITPNGDGYNDTWNILNLDKMQNVEMLISDRYGKTVFHTTDGSKAWDGTVAGRVLPTATYWYVVRWFDPATQKNEVRQGWILLKNRN